MREKGRDHLKVALGRVGKQILTSPPFGPILVLGPPRSGRTTRVCLPALLDWLGPVIVTSQEKEPYTQAYSARESVGAVLNYDPSGRDAYSATWSPLTSTRTWHDAVSTARIMIESGPSAAWSQPFLRGIGIRLLSTHLFAAGANGYTMSDVIRWINTQEEFEVRSLLQATGINLAIDTADSIWSIEQPQRNNIYAETTMSLQDWADDDVLNTQRTDEISFLPSRESAYTVLLSPPLSDHGEYRPITTTAAALMIRQVFSHNRGFAGSALALRGPVEAFRESRESPQPTLVILDDAAAVAPIPDLSDLLEGAPRAAIQMMTVFNDISQMRAIYGEREVDSMINTFSSILVLNGTYDSATRKLIDDLGGGVASLRSGGRLEFGQAFCFCRGRTPVILNLGSPQAGWGSLALRKAWGGLHRAIRTRTRNTRASAGGNE